MFSWFSQLYRARVLCFAQPPYVQGFVRAIFEGMLWKLGIQQKICIFSFLYFQEQLYFSFFFTDNGVKLLDITFSLMNKKRFVMGELVHSITMTFGKGDSASLSKEESERFRWIFFYLRKPYIYFLLVLWYAPTICLGWDGDRLPVYSC